jgi:hypothetical protein
MNKEPAEATEAHVISKDTGSVWSDQMVFIRFGSHRARDYGLRALSRRPKSFFSLRRNTSPGGVYQVTLAEVALMRAYSQHARFTSFKDRGDLSPCWTIR